LAGEIGAPEKKNGGKGWVVHGCANVVMIDKPLGN